MEFDSKTTRGYLGDAESRTTLGYLDGVYVPIVMPPSYISEFDSKTTRGYLGDVESRTTLGWLPAKSDIPAVIFYTVIKVVGGLIKGLLSNYNLIQVSTETEDHIQSTTETKDQIGVTTNTKEEV